jgi:linoleoyl-CoA desaturase
MNYTDIQFAKNRQDFFVTLSQRVNQYFKTNGISRHANGYMVLKTVCMFAFYFVPYYLMISGVFSNVWGMWGLWALMGIGMSGIGLSVMHDANHGAYSTNKWVNKILGLSLNLVGGNAFNWKVQHNVLHHTYTNIHEVDEDISPRGVIRMTPDCPYKPLHRFQYIYAWFLYGLLTFVWIIAKDFKRLVVYHKDGMVKKQKANIVTEWAILLLTKAIYVGYIFVVPMMLLPVTFWQVFVGFFIMHYIGGFILAIIFQPAHVIEGTEYPMPDEEGNLENNWAIHQLHTTTNFARENRILSWYVGGLNYQVEHHLFPNICHVHYRSIAPIVEQTAKEFGIPYKSKETFMDAMVGHFRILKALSKKEPQLATVTA